MIDPCNSVLPPRDAINMGEPSREQRRTNFLAAVLILAVEEGVAAWADVSESHFILDENNDYITARADLSVRHVDATWSVDTETARDGINLIKRGVVTPSLRELVPVLHADRRNDAEYLGASVANIIIQAGLFGRVVYR